MNSQAIRYGVYKVCSRGPLLSLQVLGQVKKKKKGLILARLIIIHWEPQDNSWRLAANLAACRYQFSVPSNQGMEEQRSHMNMQLRKDRFFRFFK